MNAKDLYPWVTIGGVGLLLYYFVTRLDRPGYTPANPSQWNPVPTDKAGALDQLANDVYALKGNQGV